MTDIRKARSEWTFTPRSEYGLRTNDAVVKNCQGRIIGAIPVLNIQQFKQGNNAGFEPINRWFHCFSKSLMRELGLIERFEMIKSR